MSMCKICGKSHSPFIMNNKPVCLRCDELLFDLEIECDETEPHRLQDKAAARIESAKKVLTISKK